MLHGYSNTVYSPRFLGCDLVPKQFTHSIFCSLGFTFGLRAAGLAGLLFSFLFGRGVGLFHRGGQIRLGRRGARLRLGDRRRRLGEKLEEVALLRHVCRVSARVLPVL